MAAENEAVIDTSLNSSGVEAGAEQVNRAVEKMAKDAVNSSKNMANQINQAFSEVKLEPTSEFNAINSEIAKLESKLDSLIDKEIRFTEIGGNTESMSFKGMEYDIDLIREKLDELRAKRDELKASGGAYKAVEQEAQALKAEAEAIKKDGDEAQKAVPKMRQFAKANKTASSSAKSGSKIFSNFAGNIKKSNIDLKSGIKNLIRYSLGVEGLLALVNRLRSSLISAFNNLAQFNGGINPTNRALSNLKSALTRLKNSFATAFNPILTTVEPILTSLIDKVSDVTTSIGMLIARLTGAKTFTKAIKVQEDYAKSLDKTAKSAKKTKDQLADYDKLSVVKKKEDDTSTKDTGSATPNQMFQTVKIPVSVDNIAEKIKETIANGDFTSIGLALGTKIKTALDNIDWTEIEKGAKKLGKSVATFINGFIASGVLSSLGKAIAGALNTGLEFADTFLTKVKWKKLGKALANSIGAFFTTFNWSKLGKTIIDALIAGINFIQGFISGINWRELPKNIVTAIKNVLKGANWKKLFASVGNLAGTILKAIWDWNKGLIDIVGNAAKTIRDYFVKKIKEAGWDKDNGLIDNGKALLKGILAGIVEGMLTIGTWINKNILQPFITEFKKSGLFDDVGKAFWNGLSGAIKAVMKPFGIDVQLPTWESLKLKLKNLLNNIIDYLNKNLVGKLNSFFEVDIPKNAATKLIGINGKYSLVKLPNIPKLATGTVVPRQAGEFAAILGDNKREPEVVSPLSTMRQALKEALLESGYGNTTMPDKIVVQLSNNRSIAEAVWDETEKRYKQTGRMPGTI